MRKYNTLIIAAVTVAMTMVSGCGAGVEAQLPEAMTEAAVSEKAGSPTEAAEDDKKESSGTGDEAEAATVSASEYPDKKYADAEDEAIAGGAGVDLFRTRAADPESGDIVDMTVYRIGDDIVKVMTEDYGSDGRIVSEYYYDGDTVAYMKQHKTDLYGINSSYKEADLDDIEADYTKEVLAQAEKALSDAGNDKGMALLYGYVGDEQGGVLANVTVKIRDVAGTKKYETVTDGDGYYSFELPQKEETYNLTYIYGSYAVSSLNDVHIVPGTPEYSLGRVYVAPEGQGVHETDVYLLNANAKSPVSLKSGEYVAVITSDDPVMSLRVVGKDKQDSETGAQIKMDPSKNSEGCAVFVEDTVNISKDDMAGAMGRTYLRVTIYGEDGIVAAYPVPAGRLGTLWKVCDIDSEGNISISGMMYTDTKDWLK